MTSFTKPLIVTPTNHMWKLMNSFHYHIGNEKSKEIIRVPKSFITDFASIPKFFWNIIGAPWGKYGKAAVIHDYLYYKQKYTRKQSDKIFYEAMGVLEVPQWKRIIMYRAVRLFGYIAWEKHRKEKK